MANLSELLLESAQAGIRMACPFCSSYRTMLIAGPTEPGTRCEDAVKVACNSCGATGPSMQDDAAAVEAWQGRTP